MYQMDYLFHINILIKLTYFNFPSNSYQLISKRQCCIQPETENRKQNLEFPLYKYIVICFINKTSSFRSFYESFPIKSQNKSQNNQAAQ